MAIDIGAGASDFNNVVVATYTMIDLTNPANAAGVLDVLELFHNTNGSGVKVGTFHGSGANYTIRDYELIGDVTSGSRQNFTGLSCDVQAGDFIGWYAAAGKLEKNDSAGSGIYYVSGDKFAAGETAYTLAANTKMALYGTDSELTTSLPVFGYHFNNMRP